MESIASMRALYKSIWLLLLLVVNAPVAASAEPVSVVAVGDLLLGGSAAPHLERMGYGYPFLGTGDLIREADIALANLEAPLTESEKKHPDKTYTFRVPPVAANDIGRAGFDLLTLANNHLGDYGDRGVLDTLQALESAGLGAVGAGSVLAAARRPHVATINGVSFAFLAYSNTFPKSFYAKKDSPGTAPGYFEYVAADVVKASAANDHVIVSFHWGGEKMTEPKDYQVALGRLAIDSGADVVIGHHPHVLQGAERYKDGVIFYSLGNYAFGSYSRNAVTAGLARMWFEGGKLQKAEILPLNVFNHEVHFQPRRLTHGPAYAFAREFNEYSEAFNTRLMRQPGLFWQIVEIQKTEEDLLAQGQKTAGHQDTKDTREGEKSL